MKVNFGKEITGVKVNKLSTGETFITDRKSTKEKGLYMVVDKNSGLAGGVGNASVLTVNLVSGQLRKFTNDYIVEPIRAEVIFTENKK